MTASNVLETLHWDSSFFSKKIAKINFSGIIQNVESINLLLNNSPYDLVYGFAKPEEGTVEVIEQLISKATFVDCKVSYVKKIAQNDSVLNPNIRSIDFIENGIYELAILSGIYSRFNRDKNFEPEHFNLLYKKWIENSVNRSIAGEVAVYYDGKIPLGLITIGKKGNRADIGLLGVDPSARGKGVASDLLNYAEQYASINNFTEIQVVTQEQNIPACKLYEKNGYSLFEQLNIFHIWK